MNIFPSCSSSFEIEINIDGYICECKLFLPSSLGGGGDDDDDGGGDNNNRVLGGECVCVCMHVCIVCVAAE